MSAFTGLQLALDRVLPASIYRADTSYRILGGIDAAVSRAEDSVEAARILRGALPSLHESFAARFSQHHAAALALKTANILLAKRQMRARDSWLMAKPVGLVVDPSNMCQLGCPGCVHSSSAKQSSDFLWPNGTMASDRFQALMQQFGPWAIAVYFCDYGEPLLNRRTPEMIRLAKQYRLHAMLSTSLSVRRFDAEAYVESGLDFMVLSIDGATQPVYERYRRSGSLELVFENIRALVKARKKRGRSLPVLSWNFLAFEHNVHEISRAIEIARYLGVDQFRVVEPFDVSWDDPDIRPAAVRPRVISLDWSTRARSLSVGELFPHELAAEQLQHAVERPWQLPDEPLRVVRSGHTCHWLYKNLVMDATGRVMPCCAAPTRQNHLEFAQYERLGDDPFNSPTHQRARRFFRGGENGDATEGNSPHCTRCEWNQTKVNIGSREIDRYFRQTDPVYFDARSRRFLTDW